jgi:hypothetical protein
MMLKRWTRPHSMFLKKREDKKIHGLHVNKRDCVGEGMEECVTCCGDRE